MKKAPFQMLLQAVSNHNILILSTRCATSCVFCSHHQNPPDIEAFYVDDISEEEGDTLIEFLDPDKEIVIGESATRICEGEPFLHKDCMKILGKIRKRYPHTKIKITTSAVPLTEEIIIGLKALGDIELNVSINSSTIEGRKKLFRGRPLEGTLDVMALLKKYEIKFHGSIVAMPHIVGWQDIEDTVHFLLDHKAESIRIFMPGYTKYTKGELPSEHIIQEINEFGEKIRKKLDIPITIEPPFIKNLNAMVEGVIKASPVFEAGIESGDRIVAVNGENVLSRVDAFNKVYGSSNPYITYIRQGAEQTVNVKKQKKSSSGLILSYDIHPRVISNIKRALHKHKGQKCAILTSELAYEIMKSCIDDATVIIQKVKNKTFGGNIICAGLLTLHDITDHLDSLQEKPDVIILPSIMFDDNGKDLFGDNYMNIYTDKRINVEVV